MDKYDYHTIFGTIREKETISSLPAVMRHFNGALIRTLAIWIDDELQDPNMLKKLKTMYLFNIIIFLKRFPATKNKKEAFFDLF